MLNAMIGNVDHKGGYLKAGGGAAQWDEGLYDLRRSLEKRSPREFLSQGKKQLMRKALNTGKRRRQAEPAILQ